MVVAATINIDLVEILTKIITIPSFNSLIYLLPILTCSILSYISIFVDDISFVMCDIPDIESSKILEDFLSLVVSGQMVTGGQLTISVGPPY